MPILDQIGPYPLVFSANLLAVALAEGLTSDELNTLGNYLTALGANILCIAAQQQYLESIKEQQMEAYKSTFDKNNTNNKN